MTQDSYRKILKIARRDLESLYRERETIERKIARLRQTIISLGAITRETKELEKSKRWVHEHESLSDAIVSVIMASEVPLHPKDIKERLEELGYDIGSSNPLASVWSCVRRLEQRKSGKKQTPYFRWYKNERARKYGRAKRPSIDVTLGVWWGDQKPAGEWERYEMDSRPKQRRTKEGPIDRTEF